MAKICVVDDHEDSREVATAWLMGEGFDVVAFAAAEDAVVALSTAPVDLILTDVMLPGMSGSELAQALRRDPRTATVPIIALTGRSDISAEPFDALVLKPFDPERLASLMRRLLDSPRITHPSEPTASPVAGLGVAREQALRPDPITAPSSAGPTTALRGKTQPGRLEADEYRVLVENAPMMMWRSGADGGCDWFNKAWLDFTGRPLEEQVERGWLEGVHPEDRERCVELYQTHFARREAFEMEYRLRCHDGSYRWIFDRGRPVYSEDGRFAGFIGSCIDVDERRLFDEAKASFLRMMAHELRTPLTPLRGYIHQLRRMVMRKEVPTLEVIDRLERQTNRVVALVQHLGEAGRLAHGGVLTLRSERFDLSPLIQRVADAHASLARDRKGAPAHELRCRGLDTSAPMIGDEGQIGAALEHVVHNAIKFSPDGCTVEIALSRSESEYQIEVIDRGIGVLADELGQLGRAYFRGRNAPRENYAGVGLGLAVTVEILEAHGGALEVTPRSGGGTRVLMKLPRPGSS